LEQRIQRLQRRAEIETQIESFFLSVQKEPLHSAIEAFVPKCVSCGSVVFWQEIPSIQRLFSVRLDISLQHNDSLIGYSFMNPGIQMIPKAGDHRSYSEKIDSRFLPAKASVMLFTLMSSQNEVVGVVQVQKRFSDPELTEYDEAFARIFAVKFRTFSEWILQPTYALSDICGLMNLLELGQFLLVFQQKMRQLFRCREAEIWIIPKKKGTVRRFVTGESYVAWADRGIVGNSESRRCCNLHPGWVLSRPLWLYSPSVFASSAQYLSLRVKLFEVMDLYEHTYRVWWSLD
jgi:hypothetical protein